MELRTLRHFIALAQEGSVSAAAESLHVTQPTLSRQLAALEDELHQQLYLRKHAGVQLTQEGAILLRYANEIVDLAEKAANEVSPASAEVAGRVHIAAGETKAMTLVARAMLICRQRHPKIRFLVYSGDTLTLREGFAKGRYDFFVECEVQPHAELNTYNLPYSDQWGILMRKDDALSEKEAISPDDLRGRSVMFSLQVDKAGVIKRWAGDAYEEYDVTCNWTLPLNSKFFVREGLGVSFTYSDLLNDDGGDLCFRPLSPEMVSLQGFEWRKVPLSKQAQAFLDVFMEVCREVEDGRATI